MFKLIFRRTYFFSVAALWLAPVCLHGQTKTSPFAKPDTLTFMSGQLPLKALLWKPVGKGPFPVVLFNHGSGPSMERVFDTLAPVFLAHGYAFFAPSRRGQNLSRGVGRPISDLMDSAEKAGGPQARTRLVIHLNETEQLQDQIAALTLLTTQPAIDTTRIAVAGVSFGGIQTLLMAAENRGVRAALDFAGGAMNWDHSELIRNWMKEVVAKVNIPVFFIQAENDFSTGPNTVLSSEMQKLGKSFRMKIYPPFRQGIGAGHVLGYFGPEIWSADVFGFLEEVMGASGKSVNP